MRASERASERERVWLTRRQSFTRLSRRCCCRRRCAALPFAQLARERVRHKLHCACALRYAYCSLHTPPPDARSLPYSLLQRTRLSRRRRRQPARREVHSHAVVVVVVIAVVAVAVEPSAPPDAQAHAERPFQCARA